ncbi:MAG: hypothetical protein LBI87_11970 [Candidatus Accumulibacter sp.]|jgi:hypothetical protein|nr:hypothetical protein [Accumulibacter sp.]
MPSTTTPANGVSPSPPWRSTSTATACSTHPTQSIHGSLVLSTRLKPRLDEIGLVIDEDGIRLGYSAMLTRFDQVFEQSHEQALVDFVEFIRHPAPSESLVGPSIQAFGETLSHHLARFAASELEAIGQANRLSMT